MISSVLILNIKQLKQINANGVTRLLNNVHSLQQNLISFTCIQDENLKRARLYFELLRMDAEEIFLFVEQFRGTFTFEEYQVILDLKYRDQPNCDSLIARLKEYFVAHRN